MAMLTPSPRPRRLADRARPATKAPFFSVEGQRQAKQRTWERQASRKKIKLYELAVFSQQLAAMLDAGLPLVACLEALYEQTENPVFRIIIRELRLDVSSGTAFSEALARFPNAFPNLFVSMVQAGEESGALAEIMTKLAEYLESSLKLSKKVKSAATYPLSVIALAVILINVVLIMVIPVFAEMFADYDASLPVPTLVLIGLSEFLQQYIIFILIGVVAGWFLIRKLLRTDQGRRTKDWLLWHSPLVGRLIQKINVSRFCRMYGTLLRSGVPILRTIEICANASDNTYIERACANMLRHVSQGDQLSDVIGDTPYFFPMVRHMARAGEQTGNVDGMMIKVADFFDNDVNTAVDSLTSLLEPVLICVLGVIVGGIMVAIFMPIFEMSSVVTQ